jgi:hypothetical protein
MTYELTDEGWAEPVTATVEPETQMDRIERKLDSVLASISTVVGIAETIRTEVEPTIRTLMKSPILKMMGVKL